METHRVVRRRGPYIFYKFDSKMAVRLSALRAGGALLQSTIPSTHFC
jgi:hypothetical protein